MQIRSRNLSKSAVLIDGSVLFFAARALFEGNLDYRALVDILVNNVDGLAYPSSSTPWVMWTSVSVDNAPQARFLDFAQRELRWEIRKTSPTDAYVVDPMTMSSLLAADSPIRNKLLRFDSSIAFALGRLSAMGYQCVVVSDSFQLTDPMSRVATSGAPSPTFAFFGRALDIRCQRFFREQKDHIPLLDLDEFDVQLFPNQARKEVPAKSASSLVF